MSQFVLYNYKNRCQPRNNTVIGNILIAKTAAQSVVGYISGADDLTDFGVMDRNYYARPFNDISTIRAVYNGNIVDDLNLFQWQAQFGKDRTSRSSPLTYKEFAVKSVGGINRIGSSSVGNSGGWETWSPYNNSQISWTPGPQPADGSLTIRFANLSGKRDSYTLVYKSIEPVVKSKSYLFRFDAVTPINKKIYVFIRQRQAPYQDLTRRYEFLVGPTRKSFEFAFTASASESDALLTFQTGEAAQPVTLDNVRLQEATIEPVDPDTVIRLVYNPTTTDSTVVLNDTYQDVKNHYYGRRVVLKPFTSVVLLRDTLPPANVSLLLRAGRTSLKIGEVTSVSLTLRNESAGRPVLPNQVQWSCRLPANLTLMTGAGLANNDSLLRGTAQRLLTDTTFVFQVKATVSGRYTLAAQVTESTYADPNSTPDSGTDDAEDDQASVTLLARELTPGETLESDPALVTATTAYPLERSMVYPNPTPDEFTFMAEEDIAAIRLVDLLGRDRLTIGAVRQGQTLRFGQSLPDAQYLLHVQYKTGERRTIKLVKASR